MSIGQGKVDAITRIVPTFFYASSIFGAASLIMGMAWFLLSPLDQFLVGGFPVRWVIFSVIGILAPFVPTLISGGITILFPLVGIFLYWVTGHWLSRSLMIGGAAGVILLASDMLFSLPPLMPTFCYGGHCQSGMIDLSVHEEQITSLMSVHRLSEAEAIRIVVGQFVQQLLVVGTIVINLAVSTLILGLWKKLL